VPYGANYLGEVAVEEAAVEEAAVEEAAEEEEEEDRRSHLMLMSLNNPLNKPKM